MLFTLRLGSRYSFLRGGEVTGSWNLETTGLRKDTVFLLLVPSLVFTLGATGCPLGRSPTLPVCTLGSATGVDVEGDEGTGGLKCSWSCRSALFVGEPWVKKGLAGDGLRSASTKSSMAAVARSAEEVSGMSNMVGRNFTILLRRIALV